MLTNLLSPTSLGRWSHLNACLDGQQSNRILFILCQMREEWNQVWLDIVHLHHLGDFSQFTCGSSSYHRGVIATQITKMSAITEVTDNNHRDGQFNTAKAQWNAARSWAVRLIHLRSQFWFDGAWNSRVWHRDKAACRRSGCEPVTGCQPLHQWYKVLLQVIRGVQRCYDTQWLYRLIPHYSLLDSGQTLQRRLQWQWKERVTNDQVIPDPGIEDGIPAGEYNFQLPNEMAATQSCCS